MLMRDAEGRKKQARSNKQQDMYMLMRDEEGRKQGHTAKQQHTQDSHFSKEKCAVSDVQTCNSGAEIIPMFGPLPPTTWLVLTSKHPTILYTCLCNTPNTHNF